MILGVVAHRQGGVVTPPAPVLWTPAEITTALWLDAADPSTVTLVSSAVEQLADKSGNGRHATQGSASLRPVIGAINGVDTLDFGSGNTTKFMSRAVASVNWRELFVVGAWDGGGTTFPGFVGLFGGSDTTGTSSGVGLMGESGTANWRINPTNTTWVKALHTNGAVASATAAFPTLVVSPFMLRADAEADIAVNGFSLGRDRNETTTNRYWKGRVGEVIASSVALSAADRSRIEGYLAWKWGLEGNLPSGHPYELAAPTV